MSIGPGHGAAEPEPAKTNRAGRKWKLALAGLIGTYFLLAVYALTAVSGGVFNDSSARPAASTVSPTAPQAAAEPASATPPALLPVANPGSTPAAHALNVASIAAFGPAGTTDGDNPGIVSRILDPGADLPWYSQWYATPDFGNLQSGTGLLLDMGKTVTVTDVRLMLGSAPGADVQLQVGNIPSLDMPSVASASGAGGTVRLTATAPANGRYVLIWFTHLPPDGQGHYQVRVYNATVDGTAGA